MKTTIQSPKKYLRMIKIIFMKSIKTLYFISIIMIIGLQCKKMETPLTQDEKDIQKYQSYVSSFVPNLDKIDDNYFEGKIDGKFFRISVNNDSLPPNRKDDGHYRSSNRISNGNNIDTPGILRLDLSTSISPYYLLNAITFNIPYINIE